MSGDDTTNNILVTEEPKKDAEDSSITSTSTVSLDKRYCLRK